jgi:ribosomal protein S18 acetylase RimI-like enzyme
MGAGRPVRRAGAEDAATVARLLQDFNAEYEEHTPPVAELEGHYSELLEAGELTVLLGGEGPDGFCQTRLKRSHYTGLPDAYIEELYVVPERRGEGLGRALLEAAMEAARAAGATHVELNTGETDTEARSLYESAGFTNREGGPDGPRMLYYEREL